MDTFYIDVYFLINFSVDFLSLHFASVLAKVPSGMRRIVFGALFGALYATLDVFLPTGLLRVLAGVVSLFLIVRIACGTIGWYRRLRFGALFLVIETALGGAVTFIYGLLDRFLLPSLGNVKGGAENRGLLFLSMIVLASFGILRLFLLTFAGTGGGNLRVKITLLGKSVVTDAFVDSGNFLVDPMDLCPVALVKPSLWRKLGVPEDLSAGGEIPRALATKIRLIPSEKGMYTAIRPDALVCLSEKGEVPVRAMIAMDKEGGTFGGYAALMPLAAVGDVRKA